MTKYSYDYYEVKIPGDMSDEMGDLKEQAIVEARERSKLYVVPCEWEVKLVSGNVGDFEVTFMVRRKRLRRVKVS